MKKYIKLLARLLITVSLIFYLFKKIDFSYVLSSFKQINLFGFLFASFLYIFSSYLSTLRWKIFLPEANIKTSKLFSLYLIGSFFNIALPGIVGGDVVKVLMIKAKVGIKEALASVFIERYIGFVALLMISFIFFCVFYSKLPQNWLIWIIPLSFFGFIMVTLILYRIGSFKFLKDLRNFTLSFSKTQIAQAFFYSLAVQFTVIFSVYVIFLSFDLSISFFKLAIYLPIIILITMLPISISGIGVREWCFILFFGTYIGQANAVAVSLLWFFSVVLASFIGGIEYLRFREFLR